MKKLGALFLTCLLSGCAVDQVVSGEEAFRAGQYDQAAAHWNPPAYAGDLRAQYYLGMLWDNGYGSTPVNASEAAEWYSRAARQGHVDAMVGLSRIQLRSGYR
ncbi:MAG TPA: hypothetical protein DHU81_06575, partial [Hyphomonas sp.]|nr:hypothetical protein [Hyphomonas sp.]